MLYKKMDPLLLQKIASYVPLQSSLKHGETKVEIEEVLRQRKEFMKNEGEKYEHYVWLKGTFSTNTYMKYTIGANEYIESISIYTTNSGELNTKQWDTSMQSEDQLYNYILDGDDVHYVYGYHSYANRDEINIVLDTGVFYSGNKNTILEMADTGRLSKLLHNRIHYPIGFPPYSTRQPTNDFREYIDIVFQLNVLASKGYWNHATRNLLDVEHGDGFPDYVMHAWQTLQHAIDNGTDIDDIHSSWTLYSNGTVSLKHGTGYDATTTALINAGLLQVR